MHTCQQCLEHRVDKKTFSSGKKIFIMHEKVYIKDSGDRPPAIVTEPILIEKMFYNPYFGKHQQTYSGEKLHEHFNRDKSFIYKTNLKVNQISHIAKSYYTCSYCKNLSAVNLALQSHRQLKQETICICAMNVSQN